jgi:hypothetical protein
MIYKSAGSSHLYFKIFLFILIECVAEGVLLESLRAIIK